MITTIYNYEIALPLKKNVTILYFKILEIVIIFLDGG